MNAAKRKSPLKVGIFWHRRKESNPRFRFWRPMRYHYTTPVGPNHSSNRSHSAQHAHPPRSAHPVHLDFIFTWTPSQTTETSLRAPPTSLRGPPTSLRPPPRHCELLKLSLRAKRGNLVAVARALADSGRVARRLAQCHRERSAAIPTAPAFPVITPAAWQSRWSNMGRHPPRPRSRTHDHRLPNSQPTLLRR